MKQKFKNTRIMRWVLLSIVGLMTYGSARASVVSYTKNPDGVTFKLDKGLMKVRICKADIVEVKYTILDAFPELKSLVVQISWKMAPAFSVTDRGGEVIIKTAKLTITVNKASNAVSYADQKGKIIASEAGENKTMNTATIAGIDTYNCTSQFNSPADEALFGLGCHPEDTLSINYKGRNQSMLIK